LNLFCFITEAVCYNVFLLFFYSQKNGLCVATRTNNTGEVLRDLSVQLLINDFSHQYSPYCGKFESLSVDNSYTFSCTMDPSLSVALVTVKGYENLMDRKWSSTIKINIEDDCFKSKGIHSFYTVCLYHSSHFTGDSKKSLNINKGRLVF